MAEPAIEVVNKETQSRYEAHLDGELIGIAEYRRTPDQVIFTHTEVFDDHGQKGVGTTLVRLALDDVRRLGIPVTAQCPFVARFIKRNPGYADLLVSQRG